MYRRVLSIVTIALFAAAGASAQQNAAVAAATPLAPADETFLREAALGGLAQLDVNYEALGTSRRRDVRAFALETVNVHAPALKQLERLAATREVAVPESLDDYPAYIPERPWRDDPASFDAVFMREQVRRLEQEVDVFTREMYDGQDDALRAYVWENITPLRLRLEAARTLLARVAPDDAP